MLIPLRGNLDNQRRRARPLSSSHQNWREPLRAPAPLASRP
jgi:hypothetical protein